MPVSWSWSARKPSRRCLAHADERLRRLAPDGVLQVEEPLVERGAPAVEADQDPDASCRLPEAA